MTVKAVEAPPVTATEAELLGRATIDRLLAAAESGEPDSTAELAEIFFLEARVHYVSYSGKWRRRLPLWLRSQGVTADRVVEFEQRWLAACRPWSDFDRQRAWRHFRQACQRFAVHLRAGNLNHNDTLVRVTRLRDDWQVLHDFCVDYIASGLSCVVDEFGEDGLELAIRFVLDGHVRRPAQAPAVVRDIASSMRGHLAGPGRRGSIEVRQEPGGWTLRFDRCGSGGRLLEDYDNRGDPSRLLRSAHDWAWGKTGVCHYCAHCCLGLTVMPIERDGLPVVAIDPPTFDLATGRTRKSYCEFHVYESADAIPVSAFHQVGKEPRPPRSGFDAPSGVPPDPSSEDPAATLAEHALRDGTEGPDER